VFGIFAVFRGSLRSQKSDKGVLSIYVFPGQERKVFFDDSTSSIECSKNVAVHSAHSDRTFIITVIGAIFESKCYVLHRSVVLVRGCSPILGVSLHQKNTEL